MTSSFINVLGTSSQNYKGIFWAKIAYGPTETEQGFAENPYRMPEVAF